MILLVIILSRIITRGYRILGSLIVLKSTDEIYFKLKITLTTMGIF